MKRETSKFSPIILSIGHSTRGIEEFTSLLQVHGVTRVVDVRTVPRSRHNPQFNKTSLPKTLRKAGIGYVHLPGLGGLRHALREPQVSFHCQVPVVSTPPYSLRLVQYIGSDPLPLEINEPEYFPVWY